MHASEGPPPSQPGSVDALSIRARAAVGAVCVRRYASVHGIEHPAIDELIEYLFALGSADNIMWWEQHAPLLARTMGCALPAEVAQVVGPQRTVAFSRLCEEVLEIGYCDLYGATTDGSKRHLLAAFQMLQADQIALPDLTPFLVSSFSKWHGWGDVVAADVVDRWRALE
ncbi:hypothetical protein [Deinococcus humi]|uniref:Uncharacterized protein n=1 Tax=Deinococcus humi TaxID=662880 RepID=A0A7W8K300_9DEIO|nr:hypothetical protein [Deinococcus humi]MBB5366354.1 hypothetical protein [Deinococcus humi]GGO41421.1 hypothetical protein GCM10008949_52210 [Deinococcus humi]